MKRSQKNISVIWASFVLLGLGSCNDSGISSPLSTNGSSSYYSSLDSSSSISSSVDTNKGYFKKDIDFGASDLNPSYPASTGFQAALVVLISFPDGAYAFGDETVSNLNNTYFGNRLDTAFHWNSLSSYYNTASYGKLNMSGIITSVYSTEVTSASIKEREKSDSLKAIGDLCGVYNDSISAIKNKTLLSMSGNEIDLQYFDSNKDGMIDSPTFITNVDDEEKWGGAFWPHMAFASDSSDKDLNFNVYSSSNLHHFDFNSYNGGARTAIHEQGHVFGLDDYYDYSSPDYPNKSLDLVGEHDMQDYNKFDWNSYSKMLTKWVSPYVIDGTREKTTIEIGDAASTGDCILIPADYSTWNGTPYDEYLLLELFSPFGNNKIDWDINLQSTPNLGSGGIRMYHVDSRLYGYDSKGGEWVEDPKNTVYTKFDHPCNSTDASDYGFKKLPSEAKGCHQLQVIQAGKENTFGSSVYTARHILNYSDLFKTGDEFTFSDYSDFFPKETTMNNGEKFNYTIEFESVSPSDAKITITKTK